MRLKAVVRGAAACLLAALLAAGASPAASAKQYDYIITGGEKLPIAVGYRFEGILSHVPLEQAHFDSPQGLYIDHGDNVYIADTGNNRILKFDASLRFVRDYTLADTSLAGPGGPLSEPGGPLSGPGGPLSGPQGVYVDQKDSLFIADTDNNRVAHIAADGTWIEEFTAPASELFDFDSYGFKPTKVALDNFGNLCVLNGSDYHGIVKIDAENGFAGYYGANKVTATLSDRIIRLFGTAEQKEQYMKRQPPYITGMFVDDAGYTYTTNTLVQGGEIKKLNQSGVNVYPDGAYVESGAAGRGQLADLHVSPTGVVTTVDSAGRRVYQYDAEGNMLCAFGGEGDIEGTFAFPVAVAEDSRGRLYVLDRDHGNVQIFRRTEFMQTVHDSLRLYKEGDYAACMEKTQAALAMDSTYLPAYGMIGRLYDKQGQYEASMEAFRVAGDMQGYSDAFDRQRQLGYREYFIWVLLAAVLLAVGTVALLTLTRRTTRRRLLSRLVGDGAGPDKGVRAAVSRWGINVLTVVHYPADAYLHLKRTRPYKQALVMVALVSAAAVFQALFTHRPLALVAPEETNLLFEVGKVLIPLFTYVLVSYGMSTLHDGEARIGDMFVGAAFSMTPFVVCMPLLTALSHLLSLNEASLYYTLSAAVWVWIFFQFYRQINILNNYTLPQTVAMILLTLCGMLAVWVLLVLLFFLSRNLFGFFRGIYTELYTIFGR